MGILPRVALCLAVLQLTTGQKNVVVDLSHHNGNVDLKQAKADGITTVIHKCTQGLKFVDSKYATNKASAEKNGLDWAAYHFADGSDGVKQAEHFLKNTGTVRRYVVDLEDNQQGTTVKKKQAEDLVQTIKTKTGQWPVVYGNAYFLEALDSKVLANCPLWIATYRKEPKIPKQWSTWLMWQYTDGKQGPTPHTVKGIGKVDRSYLKGDRL